MPRLSIRSLWLSFRKHGTENSPAPVQTIAPPVIVPPTPPRTDSDLLLQFESLGDNCEFGLMQRYAGVEPLGLFRFNFTPLEELIAGLDCRFADLAEDGQVDVNFEHGQWMIRERRYKFCYHTFNRDPSYDTVRLVREQTRWLKRMAQKFLEQLEIGDRIYVRKGEPASEPEKMVRLVSALRRIGPATLLWVTPARAGHPSGSVTVDGEGLLHGYIKSFARYDRAPDFDPRLWRQLLQRTWALHNLGDADAFPSQPRTNMVSTAIGWRPLPAATTELVQKHEAEPEEAVAFRHTLLAEARQLTAVFGWVSRSGVEPGETYVASAEVWLPLNFNGKVSLLMTGQPTLQHQKADTNIQERWQTIWVCAQLAEDNPIAYPRLHIIGPAGATFSSANWKLEIGRLPS